ncbi:MAG: hypothetical protein J5I92_01995 [Thiogranum sp.]|nr:hypothetical protein [Thiogranum sp.]
MSSDVMVFKAVAVLLCLTFSSVSIASTVYVAEINPAQSAGYVDGVDPYQISGSLRVIIEGATIRFENIDLATNPIDASSELIIAAAGDYDGFNFEYWENPPELPVLGNWYSGTFDGNALFMQATTYNGTLYDFTINSSTVTAVPLPSGFLSFSSGLFGIVFQAKRRAYSKRVESDSLRRRIAPPPLAAHEQRMYICIK